MSAFRKVQRWTFKLHVIYDHKKNTFIKLNIFSHLRRGKISNFIMAFFISSVLSTYVDIFPLQTPWCSIFVYVFTCIYSLLSQDCIVVRKSVKTSFFLLLIVIWTYAAQLSSIFVSDVFENSFEENCLWWIVLFSINSFRKYL